MQLSVTRRIENRTYCTATVDHFGNVIRTGELRTLHTILSFNGTEIVLAHIPGGKFTMGGPSDEDGFRPNESPQRQVEIAPFLMGVHTVTQEQWRAVMGTLPPIDQAFRGDNLPVSNVSWIDVGMFCPLLSEASGMEIRLPSEAEWEYGCRAGTATPFHWGPTISPLLANYNATQPYGAGQPGEFRRCLMPAGWSGLANGFGLYDLHGNVWEWCSDAWHDDYNGAPSDARPWLSRTDEGYRVQRGGSWRDRPELCRSAFRVGDIAFNRDHIVGVRVCSSAGPT